MAEKEMPKKTPKSTDTETSPSYLEPNSKKYKAEKVEEEKHVERVAKGRTAVRKKPAGKRFAEAMVGDDLADVKSYLVWDILIPAVKDTLVDLIKRGAEAFFYGGTAGGRSTVPSKKSRVSYSGYYNDGYSNRDRRREQERRQARRPGRDFDDVTFEDRRDAVDVLDTLVELTMNYGMASVADFYEMAGVPSEFTDNKYGWFELSDARIVPVRGGYSIRLPKPEPID